MKQETHPDVPVVLVVGLGNDYRTDDGAGLEIARAIDQENHPGIAVMEDAGESMSLIESFHLSQSIILIDAIRCGIEPGTMLAFDLLEDEIPGHYFQTSLHAFGVLEAIRLARRLGSLPRRLILYGIEGEIFRPGLGLSPKVRENIQKCSATILAECQKIAAETLLEAL